MKQQTSPAAIRQRALISSRGRCCLCGQMPGVVCFISGDRDDLSRDNIIVLCPHHAARLDSRSLNMTSRQLQLAQRDWQRQCLREVLASAGCTEPPAARKA